MDADTCYYVDGLTLCGISNGYEWTLDDYGYVFDKPADGSAYRTSDPANENGVAKGCGWRVTSIDCSIHLRVKPSKYSRLTDNLTFRCVMKPAAAD